MIKNIVHTSFSTGYYADTIPRLVVTTDPCEWVWVWEKMGGIQMNTSLGLKKSLDQDQTALKDVKSTLVISIKFFL